MKFIAGHPALDFVNTVGGWPEGKAREDKLENFGDLIRWAGLAKLIDKHGVAALNRLARNHPSNASRVLTQARSLRQALYRLFLRNPQPADLKFLESFLRVARRHYSLASGPDEFVWAWEQRPHLDSVLWRISESAASLLTSSDLSRIRRCAGEDCGWLFLDTTRNHSRHWCDMQDCGNLAKVRRFRARQTE